RTKTAHILIAIVKGAATGVGAPDCAWHRQPAARRVIGRVLVIIFLIAWTLRHQKWSTLINFHRADPLDAVANIKALAHQKFGSVLFGAVFLISLVINTPLHAIVLF